MSQNQDQLESRHNVLIMETSLANMIVLISAALDSWDDLPVAAAIGEDHIEHSSGPGRRPVNIPEDLLAQALRWAGPKALGKLFDCDPRTVRCRVLEYGLAEPGELVMTCMTGIQGQLIQTWNPASTNN